jgi:hypothetical protein
LNEGEKATERMWELGLPATCPSAGASTWRSEWRDALVAAGCGELVILADKDKAGEAHALVVANDVFRHLAVKVVTLPGLLRGADAFDWFGAGRTPPTSRTSSYRPPTGLQATSSTRSSTLDALEPRNVFADGAKSNVPLRPVTLRRSYRLPTAVTLVTL